MALDRKTSLLTDLEARVAAGGVRELIIATNPSIEGEATALYLQRRLASYPLTVSRIARGFRWVATWNTPTE